MRSKSKGLLGGLLFAATAPMTATGAVIADYNFGSSSSTTETLATQEAPTAAAANVTAGSLTTGTNTAVSQDKGSAVSTYYTTPGPNYLSFANTTNTDDSFFYADFIVTAATGYTFTPSSLTIIGGAGGSVSTARSVHVYDNVDGFPNSLTPTSTTPTSTGTATQLGSFTFTAQRSTGVAMNSYSGTTFTAADQNLSSLEIRVYFDTQVNGISKNIDLGELTLNGTVSAVPEPAAGLVCLVVGPLMLKRRSRVSASI